MGFYFCTAAIALYVSARHNARKVLKANNAVVGGSLEDVD
jgi:hypothetical protein